MKKINVQIKLESPLHLGSGRADVNLDAEVVHDAFGVPYFPAKRFKGLLYESAVEVQEMFACCQSPLFGTDDLASLFQRAPGRKTQLIIHDLYLAEYAQMRAGWSYLQSAYSDFITPQDVLKSYTSVRYQTKIDAASGTVEEGSLRNLRVVDAGLVFGGDIALVDGTDKHEEILLLALHNLTAAGMKRNRGFGKISCILAEPEQNRLKKILGER